MTKQEIIPLHRLEEWTDDGFQIDRVESITRDVEEAISMGTHRDDHYIFLMQERGYNRFMVDFSHFIMEGSTIFYVLPGQVHCYLETKQETSGWFVALDTGRVPEILRTVLEDPLLVRRPMGVTAEGWDTLSQCLQLLYTISRREGHSVYNRQAVHGLLDTFVALFTALFTERPGTAMETPTRPVMITQSFRRLLLQQYKVNKSPIEYANALNISLSYLNEVVKATTGQSVSTLIQQEVVLEAKRLLFHSGCSVKEIAHALGYEDHAYFSRLFKKAVGSTPGEFRRHHRE